jgi:hypothetical protein
MINLAAAMSRVADQTPLHLACLRGNTEVVRFLIEVRNDGGSLVKDINTLTARGDTALHYGNTVDGFPELTRRPWAIHSATFMVQHRARGTWTSWTCCLLMA